MASEYQNRRYTDPGHVPQFPTTLKAIRWALGLVPTTESLRPLSHWRRRPAAQQEMVAGD